MLRLCDCSCILFTIYATSTIIAVAEGNCNGKENVRRQLGKDYVDGRNVESLREIKIKTKPPKHNNPVKTTGLPKGAGRRCCPYNFDSKICRTVGDRVLCGYNMNAGQPQGQDSVVELHGGCRLRGGRLECGYQHGPFTNPRRPPAWNMVTDHAVIKTSVVYVQ
ncbi:hypothetical protein PYW07_005873 [Mythimna separata]|uniref:Secreted protein n=1 Tax=Mythimna separata TaxID=271217 RepID=A0AAD8DR31_MYTSE|nr:hypothetical protein PYW07_005873 [Mythimna separata]